MSVLTKPQQFKVYECRVNIRENYQGRECKPGVQALNNQVFTLEVLWKMGKDDPYPGEYALFPTQREQKEVFVAHDLGWISSGDVVFIKQV